MACSLGDVRTQAMLESHALPGCYFMVGNGDGKPGSGPGCMVHTTGYDFQDAILPTTASFWVALVRRYLA